MEYDYIDYIGGRACKLCNIMGRCMVLRRSWRGSITRSRWSSIVCKWWWVSISTSNANACSDVYIRMYYLLNTSHMNLQTSKLS